MITNLERPYKSLERPCGGTKRNISVWDKLCWACIGLHAENVMRAATCKREMRAKFYLIYIFFLAHMILLKAKRWANVFMRDVLTVKVWGV